MHGATIKIILVYSGTLVYHSIQ